MLYRLSKSTNVVKNTVLTSSVLKWPVLSAVSPTGLMLIESFVKSHNDICAESLCDYQPIDPMSQSKNVKVPESKELDSASFINDAENVARYLRSTLDQNEPGL